jgi:hypothetical protein
MMFGLFILIESVLFVQILTPKVCGSRNFPNLVLIYFRRPSKCDIDFRLYEIVSTFVYMGMFAKPRSFSTSFAKSRHKLWMFAFSDSSYEQRTTNHTTTFRSISHNVSFNRTSFYLSTWPQLTSFSRHSRQRQSRVLQPLSTNAPNRSSSLLAKAARRGVLDAICNRMEID